MDASNRDERVPLAERLSLSVDEALKLTGLSRNAFYTLVSRGEMPSFTIGARRFVSGPALRDWVAMRTSSAQPIAPEQRERYSRLRRVGRIGKVA